MAQARPRGLGAARPKNTKNWVTRRDWGTKKGYTIDYMLSGGSFEAAPHNAQGNPGEFNSYHF